MENRQVNVNDMKPRNQLNSLNINVKDLVDPWPYFLKFNELDFFCYVKKVNAKSTLADELKICYGVSEDFILKELDKMQTSSFKELINLKEELTVRYYLFHDFDNHLLKLAFNEDFLKHDKMPPINDWPEQFSDYSYINAVQTLNLRDYLEEIYIKELSSAKASNHQSYESFHKAMHFPEFRSV